MRTPIPGNAVLVIAQPCLDGRVLDSTGKQSVTANGPVWSVAPSQQQFGPGLYFDGSNDNLSIAHTTDLNLLPGNSDFYVGAWVYLSANTGRRTIATKSYSSGTTEFIFWVDGGVLVAYVGSTSGTDQLSGGGVSVAVWTHVALSRVSGVCRLFVNGVVVATKTLAYSTAGTGALLIGYSSPGSNFFSGYMTNLLIAKGGGTPSGAFDPPRLPLV